MTVFKKHITHDPCPLFSTEFSKISSCIAGPKFPGWKGFSELSENWWTEKRPEEALRVAAFLRFLQELFCKNKTWLPNVPTKTKRGKRVSVGDNEDDSTAFDFCWDDVSSILDNPIGHMQVLSLWERIISVS